MTGRPITMAGAELAISVQIAGRRNILRANEILGQKLSWEKDNPTGNRRVLL
jgi:hypothetical protein